MEEKIFRVGQVVTVQEDGEYFGKDGIVKEIFEEDCAVRMPTSDGEYFDKLYFAKSDLK